MISPLLFIFLVALGEDDCELVGEDAVRIQFDFKKIFSFGWWLRHFADAYAENPFHMVTETVFIVLIIYLSFRRAEKVQSSNLSEEDHQVILQNWTPKPLVPDHNYSSDGVFSITNAVGPVLSTDIGKQLLNFTSSNFLGFANNPKMLDEAEKTIRKFAVGSCGPRGFYGTMDVHLNLENKLSEAFSENSEPVQAVIYADWLGVPSSVVTAFSKKGDLIVADERISYLWRQGIKMSRAKVVYFSHNNLDDLESKLQNIQQQDNQDSHFQLNRRFIITESIYQNSGQILDLPRLVAIKNRYKFRLIVDDSNGFGALDKRGIAGYYNIQFSEIDVYACAMDKSLGSIGGFVVGNEEITNRQTLYSFGYVFSASAPPFQVNCANLAVDMLSRDLCAVLQEKIHNFRKMLKLRTLKVSSHSDSPLVFLRSPSVSKEGIAAFRDMCLSKGLLIFTSSCLPEEHYNGEPYVRLSVMVEHTTEMLKQAAQILAQCESCLQGNAI